MISVMVFVLMIDCASNAHAKAVSKGSFSCPKYSSYALAKFLAIANWSACECEKNPNTETQPMPASIIHF
jgi:hypothetical protein